MGKGLVKILASKYGFGSHAKAFIAIDWLLWSRTPWTVSFALYLFRLWIGTFGNWFQDKARGNHKRINIIIRTKTTTFWCVRVLMAFLSKMEQMKKDHWTQCSSASLSSWGSCMSLSVWKMGKGRKRVEDHSEVKPPKVLFELGKSMLKWA